ncbi:hypothetical protein [Nannocystis pusilla]|uniref:hypothetical protein n=1 Tax=Nannocystis pusilla TaxID=889268 RepID=UPI003DA3F809
MSQSTPFLASAKVIGRRASSGVMGNQQSCHTLLVSRTASSSTSIGSTNILAAAASTSFQVSQIGKNSSRL